MTAKRPKRPPLQPPAEAEEPTPPDPQTLAALGEAVERARQKSTSGSVAASATESVPRTRPHPQQGPSASANIGPLIPASATGLPHDAAKELRPLAPPLPPVPLPDEEKTPAWALPTQQVPVQPPLPDLPDGRSDTPAATSDPPAAAPILFDDTGPHQDLDYTRQLPRPRPIATRQFSDVVAGPARGTAPPTGATAGVFGALDDPLGGSSSRQDPHRVDVGASALGLLNPTRYDVRKHRRFRPIDGVLSVLAVASLGGLVAAALAGGGHTAGHGSVPPRHHKGHNASLVTPTTAHTTTLPPTTVPTTTLPPTTLQTTTTLAPTTTTLAPTTTTTSPKTTTTTTASGSTTTTTGPPGTGPVLASISPTSGPVGTMIDVRGFHFISNNGEILAKFNGQPAPTACPNQNTCQVTVPNLGPNAGALRLTITTSAGTSNAISFHYKP